MVRRPARWHPARRLQVRPLSRSHRVHANTFAARAGRWSAQHRKTAIWGWIAFVVVAFVIGGAVGVKKPSDYVGPGDSGRADQLALDHFPKDQSESVLIQAPKGGSARSAAVRNAVGDTIAAVRGKAGVAEIESPYAKGNESQIAKDGRSVLVTFKVRGDQDQTSKRIDPIVSAVDRVKAQNSGVYVGEFGGASADKALSKSFEDDFKKAEKLSLPITLAILIVALPSQIVPMDDMISSIILLIGLAVGVDYTLFYLRREREEKAKGAGKIEAVHTAAATSGRAVLVSGFTVMAAMAGMLLAGDRTFTSLGIGAIMVVAVAMIGSVTVVPAMLAWLGHRVDKGRVPFLHRIKSKDGDSRVWGAVLSRVLKRPALSAGLAAAVLVALAIPAFSMHTVQTGTDDLPRKLEVMKVYDRMQAAFPGGEIPAVVTVQADDLTSPQFASAVKDLER